MRESKIARSATLAALCAVLGVGCTADIRGTEGASPEAQGLGSELTIGSSGEDVRAAHEYLTRFGYLPNDTLQREYPRWRPLVSDSPAHDDVFDEHSAEAVLALQRYFGLPETGTIDDATGEFMKQPRCGVPDGVEPSDPTEKFSLRSSSLGSSVTWRFAGNTDDGLSLSSVKSSLSAAFKSWSNETKISFSETEAGGDIEIRFKYIDGPGGTLAQGDYAPNGSDDLIFDTSETWVTGLAGAGQFNLQTVALHEIGHNMGIAHSSISGATMWPVNMGTDTSLHADDKVAASVKYDGWTGALGATAKDVGVGGSGAVWIITSTTAAGGYTIKQWNGTGWTAAPGGAARIAVSATGIPWVLNSNGSIFKFSSSSASTGSWTKMAGCAADIAIASGQPWVTGCSDGNVYQFNSSTSSWDLRASGYNATRLAVDRSGVVWFVAGNGEIYKLTSGTVTKLTGCASDIGAWNDTWIIGCSSVTGGKTIHAWNQQPVLYTLAANHCNFGGVPGQCASGQFCDRSQDKCYLNTPAAPAEAQWIKTAGGASAISVGPTGPWLVNSSGSVFQQDKAGTAN